MNNNAFNLNIKDKLGMKKLQKQFKKLGIKHAKTKLKKLNKMHHKNEDIESIDLDDELREDVTLAQLDPTVWIEKKFSTHRLQQINNQYISLLKNRREEINHHLQDLVYENYEKFIETSKLIESFLESEVLELGNALSDVKTNFRIMYSIDLSKMVEDGTDYQLESLEELLHDNTHNEVEDMIQDFDVHLELREFEEAVNLIRKIEASLGSDTRIRRIYHKQLKERNSRLKSLIIQTLRDPCILKSQNHLLITCLRNLTNVTLARTSFLESRSEKINQNIRNVDMQGDIQLYIRKVATIIFQCILETGKEFKELFQDHRDNSAFTQWILRELTSFADLFRTQVFGSNSFTAVADCVKIVFNQCKMLENEGISVSFRFEQLLKNEIIKSIEELYSRIEYEIRRGLTHENWNGGHYQFDIFEGKDIDIRLSESCNTFFQKMIQFCHDIELVKIDAIYQTSVSSVNHLIEDYIANMSQLALTEQMNDKRFLTIISNAKCLNRYLLAWVIERFTEHFNRNAIDLQKLSQSIGRLEDRLVEKFCSSRGKLIVEREIQWNSLSYPSQKSSGVTISFKQLFGFLSSLTTLCNQVLPHDSSANVIRLLIQKVLERMSGEGIFWKRLDLLNNKEMIDQDGDQFSQWKLTQDQVNQIGIDLLFFYDCSQECNILNETTKSLFSDIKNRFSELVKTINLPFDFEDKKWKEKLNSELQGQNVLKAIEILTKELAK